MCMNASPNVLERLKVRIFIVIDIFFFKQIGLNHGVTQGDNVEIQNAARRPCAFYFKI